MYKLTKRLIKTQKASKHIIFVAMDDLMDSGELLCKKMLFYMTYMRKGGRKMKKKVISILLASVLTLSMLAGCGNDSAPSGGSSGQSSAAGGEDSSADATDDKADAPKIEISIMSWHGEGGESKFYDGLKYVMDSYTEVHPNVTFKYVQQPLDGYMDLLDTQFISGGAADIIHMQPHMAGLSRIRERFFRWMSI